MSPAHSLTSKLVFAFPFSLIYKLQLKPKMKIGVYAVLMLGLIDIAFSVTRFASVELGVQDDFISLTLVCKSYLEHQSRMKGVL